MTDLELVVIRRGGDNFSNTPTHGQLPRRINLFLLTEYICHTGCGAGCGYGPPCAGDSNEDKVEEEESRIWEEVGSRV